MLNETRLLVNGRPMTIRAFTNEEERKRVLATCAEQEAASGLLGSFYDFQGEGEIVGNSPDVKEIEVPFVEEPEELFDKGDIEF